ncbi:hypothetical protein Taro_047486 [Colocasia esculenta]|uniref:Uncharacterized protein n=1 Tax=Colocasia esculenta TaxID=4460 RepID=A0A843X766_COLES|nr:hypothetical protein [Colocasia esculenta]
MGHSCHLVTFSGIPAVFWPYGTFLSFGDIPRELPSSPASSHAQDSARHFIEATWVPLHRIGQEARTVRLSLPFSAPQGRICNFPGSKGTSAILSFIGIFLQFSQTQGYSCKFLANMSICVLLTYTNTNLIPPGGLCAISQKLGPVYGAHVQFHTRTPIFSSPGGPSCNFTQTGSRTGVFIRRTNRSTPSQRRGTSPEDLREGILERQMTSSFAGTREHLASVGEEKSLRRGSPRESFTPLEAEGVWRVEPAEVRDPAGGARHRRRGSTSVEAAQQRGSDRRGPAGVHMRRPAGVRLGLSLPHFGHFVLGELWGFLKFVC